MEAKYDFSVAKSYADAVERLSALGRAAETPEIREEIIQMAMNMCLPPNAIEITIGALSLKGMVYVGVLPEPKGGVGLNPVPQLLCRVDGDDLDRSLTKYRVELPPAAINIYREWCEYQAGVHNEAM